MGGIQAVGAMAIGTESIEPVHMLVGPEMRLLQKLKDNYLGVLE